MAHELLCIFGKSHFEMVDLNFKYLRVARKNVDAIN